MTGTGDKENLLAAGAALWQHLRTPVASENFSAQGRDKLQQAPARTWEILISQIIKINFTAKKTNFKTSLDVALSYLLLTCLT